MNGYQKITRREDVSSTGGPKEENSKEWRRRSEPNRSDRSTKGPVERKEGK
jgi:hypothetical protein